MATLNNDRNNKVQLLKLLREKHIRAVRKSFYEYCRLMLPKIYCKENGHLEYVCNVFQEFYLSDKYFKLMFNMPPRHGKTITEILFSQWVLGRNVEERIITVSYNEKLSSRFARMVRDGIDGKKDHPVKICYNDIFPETKIKEGDASYQVWSLEGQFFNYLSTSFNASIGGFGITLGIIDDPIKSKAEAYNEIYLAGQYDWYKNTFTQRLEEGAKIIITTTRWATKDLCGCLLKDEPGEWKIINMEACTKGKMLAPKMLSKKSYLKKKSIIANDIFQANYHNEPVDIMGTLYKGLKTYTEIPEFEQIISYTDTADEGTDLLCSIVAGVYKKMIYILDIYISAEGMEITEPGTAEFFVRNKVDNALIESNNGGRGFARNVERELKEKYNTNKPVIDWFHQSKNKKARILSQSNYVMRNVYFPEQWQIMFPEFYQNISTYQKEGKNKHDDPADALTGLTEMVEFVIIINSSVAASGKREF